MRISGIDLAAEASNTGVATVAQQDHAVVVQTVEVGVSDDDIVATVHASDMTGVDVPIGWPQRFVELIAAHADYAVQTPENTAAAWRRSLAMRATDMDLHRRTGLTPLSVSTNFIAYPALRWAGIEARLRDEGVDVSRDGSGAVAEVYPAAALHRWRLPHRKYKGSQHSETRETIVGELPRRFPTFDWNGFEQQVIAHDDALDAVLSALTAYQVTLGNGEGPPGQLRELANVEGWIWVPKPLPEQTTDFG